jgi:hypothetical protein
VLRAYSGPPSRRVGFWHDDLLEQCGKFNTTEKQISAPVKINKFLKIFTRKKIEQVSPHSDSVEVNAPIIIGGDGRSGTTLLSVLLNSHSDISQGPELHFNGKKIPNLGSYILECNKEMSADRRASVSELKPGVQFIYRCERFGISRSVLCDLIQLARDTLKTDLINFEDRCFLIQLMGNHLAKVDKKTRFGFKIMREISNITKYGEVWPGASFTHIIRDGRDVAASHLASKYSWGYGDIENAAHGWVRIITKARATSVGYRYREIEYENLVSNLEEEMRRLIAWLGEEWDERILAHELQEHSVIKSKVSHYSKQQVRQPVNTNAIQRYKTILTAKQIQVFEAIAGDLLQDLGYKLSSSEKE